MDRLERGGRGGREGGDGRAPITYPLSCRHGGRKKGTSGPTTAESCQPQSTQRVSRAVTLRGCGAAEKDGAVSRERRPSLLLTPTPPRFAPPD